MPPLSSGNPFRRFPSGSSQQITNLRYFSRNRRAPSAAKVGRAVPCPPRNWIAAAVIRRRTDVARKPALRW
ncbi:hypothetical protein SBV1_880008 [Verrucomicrobia bacterium]|nr:hypothetical protein SBV1_880008 [Verrucomicrobiota bacterium]